MDIPVVTADLKELKSDILANGNLPKHVAIIMDGNGRWAKSKSKPRIFGHRAGVKTVRRVTELAGELGLETLTLYTFSSENWKRPKLEVSALMNLLLDTITREVEDLHRNNVRLTVIGDLDSMPKGPRKGMQDGILKTADNTGLNLNLALNYGGRQDILQAVKTIGQAVESGELKADEISDELISRRLYTGAIDDPDLLIRTSGEFRLSNFLLWQLAYTENESPEGVSLVIGVEEYPRLDKVVLEGNDKIKTEDIDEALKLHPGQALTPFIVYESRRIIENLYYDDGYLLAEIEPTTFEGVRENTRGVKFQINLYEGKKYKYGKVAVTGNTVFESEDILAALGISTGDQYNSEKLMEAIEQSVRGPYMDKGYLYCQIIPVEMPIGADVIDLTLEITEMNPVHVRHINIVGNDKTKENVIRRELRIFPGDLFSRTALMRSQREVMILNYFGNVVPDVIPYDDDEIDLVFEVEEKNTGTATASAGYSERDGFIGTVGLQFPNFRGNGQQLSFNFQRAYSYEALSISFVEPWLFDTPNLLGISLFDQDRSQNSNTSYFGATSSYSTPYDVHTTGGSVTFGRRFQWPDNYFRGRWTFRGAIDRYDLDKIYYQSIFDRVNPAHLEKTSGISLTQIISRDSRNAPEFPTNGSVLTLNSVYSGGVFGGNESFFKQKASLEWYTPIWKDKLAMRNYFEGGMLNPIEQDSSHIIPYDEYFFMGGAGLIYGSALRGYAERSVGTLDGDAYFGGMASFKYTLEMRYLLSPNPMMYLIGFAEAGNVWDDFDSSNLLDLKRSIGFGGRVIMPPLGMLGIDIGWGFDKDPVPDWKSPEYHFIFGQQF